MNQPTPLIASSPAVPSTHDSPEDSSRRGFVAGLTSLLALGATAAGVVASLPAAEAGSPAAALDTSVNGAAHKHNFGMAIDLDLCTACGACVVACRTENNVACAGPDEANKGTEIYWMDVLPRKTVDPLEATLDLIPTPCLQCENAPCVKVCPVGATYISDEGIVAQIWDRCIGCRYCETACPYTRRYFNWTEPNFPESYRNALNPDVATRPRGVIEKCTFCVHRIRKVEEQGVLNDKPPTDADFEYMPACAQACPAKAIVFGDLNDPDSHVSRLNRSPRVFRLLEYLGTKPKVFYLGKDRSSDA
ncbi:MAG TPA: 4Fe-4S dicluster domain-containing protein [Planctomycetota bacterium]|nr:4Fe-4S dicluster domain-containing protein [Planctomycetota bacterium]